MEASIIIPFYNAKKHLTKNYVHIEELLNNIQNIEVIYIDDASSDEGFEYLKLKVRKNERIKLFKNKTNKGPGIARNLGLKKANGQKIIFLDVDDRLDIKELKVFLKKFKKSTRNFFFNYKIRPKNINYFKKNPVNKSYKKNLKDFLINTNDKNVIFCCLNKNFLLKNKITFSSGFHEDVCYKFKLFFFSKKPFKKYNKILYHKFDNKSSITGKNFNQKNLLGFIKAWQDIGRFIKIKKLIFLKKEYQFRLRGEYINLYNKLVRNRCKKKHLILLLNIKFLPLINKKFVISSKKDNQLSKLLLKHE